MAYEIIAEKHPLLNTPVWEIFWIGYPWRGCFTDYWKRLRENNDDFEGDTWDEMTRFQRFWWGLGNAITGRDNYPGKRKEEPAPAPEEEGEEGGGPAEPKPVGWYGCKGYNDFNLLGFGIVAFVDLLQTLIFIFIVMTFLMSPAMKFYKTHTGYGKPKGYD